MRLTTLLEKKSNSNVSEATIQLLKSLKVPVTATTAVEAVENHPDFPSLYSISDSLQKWKVENAAFQVPPEKLDSLPTPFIAHTLTGGGSFVLVKAVNGRVEFINEKGKAETQSREEFLKAWTTNVLLAEKSEESGEKDYTEQRKKEVKKSLRIPLMAGAGLLLVGLFAAANIENTLGFAAILLLFTKLLGCVVTGLLLWFEVDKAAPLLQQICSGNKNTNCTAVLGSKSAKLFNWLSWSEVGFFYFAGSFLCLTLTSTSTFSLLAWLNLFALPYTFFSVYYQWRIAKQWCPLCLAVQGLLVAEAVICYLGHWWLDMPQPLNFSTPQLLTVSTSFLLPVLFWAVSKKAFLGAKEGRREKKELARFKYNPGIFEAVLQKQKAVTVPTDGLGISLGNPAAKHKIIKVCNPYCGPCAKAHKDLEELMENSDVNLQIIFTATDDEKDSKAPPVRHLMAVAAKGDAALTKRALDDWYNADKKDYDDFAANYSLTEGELTVQGEKLKAMDNWCKATGISFTPTIFINGHQLTDAYGIKELKHIL